MLCFWRVALEPDDLAGLMTARKYRGVSVLVCLAVTVSVEAASMRFFKRARLYRRRCALYQSAAAASSETARRAFVIADVGAPKSVATWHLNGPPGGTFA